MHNNGLGLSSGLHMRSAFQGAPCLPSHCHRNFLFNMKANNLLFNLKYLINSYKFLSSQPILDSILGCRWTSWNIVSGIKADWTRDIVQEGECFPRVPEALDSIPNTL